MTGVDVAHFTVDMMVALIAGAWLLVALDYWHPIRAWGIAVLAAITTGSVILAERRHASAGDRLVGLRCARPVRGATAVLPGAGQGASAWSGLVLEMRGAARTRQARPLALPSLPSLHAARMEEIAQHESPTLAVDPFVVPPPTGPIRRVRPLRGPGPCRRCGEERRMRTDRGVWHCPACARRSIARWRAMHPEKLREYVARYRAAGKRKGR